MQKIRVWLLASLAGFLCSLVVVVGLIAWGHQITALGLSRSVFFVALVVLGMCAAGFLFGALHSYARYKGQLLNGTIELGGPVVALMLIVISGLALAPPTQFFDLVIRVQGSPDLTKIIDKGTLTVDIASDRRTLGIGPDGQVHVALSTSLINEPIRIIPNVLGYAAKDTGPIKIPDTHVIYLELAPQTHSSVVHGRLQYAGGQPVAGAVLSVDDGVVTSTTNERGEFRFVVPFEEGHRLRLTAALNGKIGYDNVVAVPIGTTLSFSGGPQ